MPSLRLLFCVLSIVVMDWSWGLRGDAHEAQGLRVALFDIDASPPVGSALPYSSTESIVSPLRCKGMILLSDAAPIVLCAVDWLGIGNDGNRIFRERMAAAAGTVPERVAVHTLHQHDAPWCDFSAEELARSHGATGLVFDSGVARDVLERATQAVRESIEKAVPITHIGLGEARVDRVASNRRVLGPDGRVAAVRWTATKDPAVRAAPEGVIDPLVRSLSWYNGDRCVAVLTYYATHPQSYYGKGDVNPDFPGLARGSREQATGVPHIHFCGAGGNVGAGKYNDGATENRAVLAERLADGMRRALESEQRVPVATSDLGWTHRDLHLPPTPHLTMDALETLLADASKSAKDKIYAATQWIWLRRCAVRDPIQVSCLKIGPARVLHLPGELFVEYQLAAAEMLPGEFVAVAAYGDYAPCYIGTAIAYAQGGYETGRTASLVAPECEPVLIEAIQALLGLDAKPWPALGVAAAQREAEQARNAPAK